MKEKKITGNTAGVRRTALEDIRSLFDMAPQPGEYCSTEMIEAICAHTAALNREIGVYISRDGEILDVKIGTSDHVSGTDSQKRRSANGLNGVRCIHTHPGGSPVLSEADTSMMHKLLMDSICAVGVDAQGRMTGIHAAFFTGEADDLTEEGYPDIEALNDTPWLRRITEAGRSLSLLPDDEEAPEKAILVSIDRNETLDELRALAEASGAQVVKKIWQNKAVKDTAYYIGPGKADEIRMEAQILNADLVIFDDELSGKQIRNLEDRIGIKVIDRTALILDIFAQRALSEEGKLQVAAAQARYRSGKLIGQGLVLSRLGGGIGTRGPGETQLEMDRRVIRRQLKVLEDRLDQMESRRASRRKQREKNETPIVALVGYTNTGKSTLMNRMSNAGVLVRDQLFATLDAVSKSVSDTETPFILVDTVGFIDKLPHDLVRAFRSTLEEAALADVLVLVHDASDPRLEEHRQTVLNVLEELGAASQPRIEALNKADKVDHVIPVNEHSVAISALTGKGIDDLKRMILDVLQKDDRDYSVFIPYSRFQTAAKLEQYGRVREFKDEDTGRRMIISMKEKDRHQAEKRLGIVLEEV